MNKRKAHFAFLNLRVLIGLLTLTGVFLTVVGFGTFAVRAANTKQSAQSYTAHSIDPLLPLTPISCSVSSAGCGAVVFSPPADFTVNVSEAVDVATVQASDFTVNGTPSNLPPTIINGNSTITFHYTTSPVTTPGFQTMHIPAGAFNCGGGPVLEFTCSFFYSVLRPTPTPRCRPTHCPRPDCPCY